MEDVADGTHTWVCEECCESHQSQQVVPRFGYLLYAGKSGQFFACSAFCAMALLKRMIDAEGR